MMIMTSSEQDEKIDCCVLFTGKPTYNYGNLADVNLGKKMQRSATPDPGSNNQFTRYLLNLSRPLALKFASIKNEPRWLRLKSETIFSSAFSELTFCSYKAYTC